MKYCIGFVECTSGHPQDLSVFRICVLSASLHSAITESRPWG